MKLSLLPLLACPACRGELAFSRLESMPRESEDLQDGALACRLCSREYPIVEGVPQMFPDASLEPRVRRTGESFGWEWLRYPGAMPEDRPIFLAETQLPESAWAGRLVLDGGCGMGRYARVALELGAEVVAFDLSESLQRLVEDARRFPKLHLVRGDILKPPFKPKVFDVVYSLGVIHHTKSAEAALKRLGALVKPQGLLTLWVYGRPGSWRSFSTNPLRGGREWLKGILPLVWSVVWARMILSDLLRVFTTRLPVPLLYALCHPLAALGALPLLKYATFSAHPDYRVRLQENFDWLAPPYQSKHTKEELSAWFASAGFEVLGRLAHGVVPKVGFLGRKGK